MTRFVVPIRSFATGFERLRPTVDDAKRRSIAQDLARRVISAARTVGEAVVVTAEAEVADFAKTLGAETIAEPEPGGLNVAASAGIAGSNQWVVVHADLPLITETDLQVVADLIERDQSVIAPTHDGGTSLVGGTRTIEFAFGPGSFRRHLAIQPTSTVLIRKAFLMDLDTADDVRRLLA